MRSVEPRVGQALSERARERLRAVAVASIDHGLARGARLPVDAALHAAELRALGASFVTLRRGGQLRGCVGSLEARLPLVESVAHGAFSAAFRDPRFPPLCREERADLDIHVTILGPMTPIQVRDERELLAQLRPGVDGLVVRLGKAQATLLPAVWQSLQEPERFLAALWEKAGLPAGHWSPEIEVLRYEAIELT